MKSSSKSSSALDKKTLHKAVAGSSKMERLSFDRAKKNEGVIKQLQSYGRAFAL